MTTEIKCELIEDILASKWILRGDAPFPLPLSAASWLVEDSESVFQSRLACLEAASDAISESFPDYESWLFVTNEALYSNTRITRHQKLWKSLAARGLLVPFPTVHQETIHESKGGLRFFGAAKFERKHLHAVNAILLAERLSQIVCVQAGSDDVIRNSLEHGWLPARSYPSETLLSDICGAGGMVLGVYGEFDDRQISTAAIGRRELIQRLKC
jgi:hypothetical protein